MKQRGIGIKWKTICTSTNVWVSKKKGLKKEEEIHCQAVRDSETQNRRADIIVIDRKKIWNLSSTQRFDGKQTFQPGTRTSTRKNERSTFHVYRI